MTVRRTYQSRNYQLRLVEYPRTRRYEIQGLDLEDGEWVVNVRIKVVDYDYYKASSQLSLEVIRHERDGLSFTEVF